MLVPLAKVRLFFTGNWNRYHCHQCDHQLVVSRNQASFFLGTPFLMAILAIRLVPWIGFGLEIRGWRLALLFAIGFLLARVIGTLWFASTKPKNEHTDLSQTGSHI